MTRVSAAIIKNKDKEILICQRGPGGSCQFLWEFPGGKIEEGETPEECLVRECKEELDIGISVQKLFAHTTHSYPERDIEFLFFNASLKNGIPTPSVHDSIKWVSPCELKLYEFCPADVPVVKKLTQNI